jgi:hypothetical protein
MALQLSAAGLRQAGTHTCHLLPTPQGVTSPLAGQMFFRASLFGAFGESKRWLGKNPDGSVRALSTADFYKAGAITGFIAAFTEGPIDFYKSQIQVQIIKSKVDPNYKRECPGRSAPLSQASMTRMPAAPPAGLIACCCGSYALHKQCHLPLRLCCILYKHCEATLATHPVHQA